MGPDRRLPDDAPLRRRLHGAVALAQAGRRAGPRLLRRPAAPTSRCARTSSCAPRTAASATRRRASGARRRRRCGCTASGLRALQAPAAHRRRDRRRAARSQWGLASEAVPDGRARGARGLALARRVGAAAPQPGGDDEAARQPGLRADGPARRTQLVGTLLDGAARHTPEGTAFTAARPGRRPRRRGRARRPVRRLRAGARDGVGDEPARLHRGRSWPAAAAGASAATRRWSSSRAGRSLHYPLSVAARRRRRGGRRGQAVDRPAGPRRRGRDLAGGRRAPPSGGGASCTRCAAPAGGRCVVRGRRHALRRRAGSSARSRASARAARPPVVPRAAGSPGSRCAPAMSRGR